MPRDWLTIPNNVEEKETTNKTGGHVRNADDRLTRCIRGLLVQ